MKIQDLLENKAFHDDTTEMSFYDDMINADDYTKDYYKREKGLVWELVKMAPEKYIDIVSKEKNIPKSDLLANREKSTIDKYAKQMAEGGRKFPVLTLDYSRGKQLSQEGLHRSFAALKAGIKEVPVLIVKSTD